MKIATTENLFDELRFERKKLQEVMDKFVTSFQESPMRALDWANTTYRDAAKLEVNAVVTEMLMKVVKGEMSFGNVVEAVEEKKHSGAIWPTFSTSPSSNLMALYMTSAWAEMVNFLKVWAKRIEARSQEEA